ncbi:MAG: Ig-like domain-containing protein, partial [Muribaculaceae bacterium]|nr:Ig-like domain-containing protein [Muribaculaceae bacterium]
VTFKFEPNNNNNVSATAVKKGSAQIETFYYLVGAFNGWGQKDENYKFTNEADGTHLLENVDLTAGGFKFMDSNGSWYGDGATVPATGGQITVSGNNGDNNNLATGGNYNVLLDLNNNKAVFTLNEEVPLEITAVELMGSGNSWAAPLASFVVENASTGYWVANDVQFAANDEFKIRVSYSDQSVKWLMPVSDGNFLVDENQLGQELTLTTEGGMNNMYVEQDATLSFSLAPGFGALVITGEFVQPEPALTLHHGHDGQNDWQIVEFTYEDGIFTGPVALAEDEVFYFTNEAGAWFPTNENQGAVYELHSGWCTEIPLDGAGCQFFKMAEASTFTFIVQPFNEEYPQFDVEGWPAHDLEMYLYGNITDGGWENGTLMDVLEPNSHWLKYFTVEDVNNGNGYLKLGKAATFSDDTAIGAVDDADNYEVIAESAQALRALQIPMVDGGKAIEIAAGYYAMHVWYNAETGEGRVQFDPQNVPIGKVEILVPDDGLVIEQGQTLQLEAAYTPQYTTNADLTINWLSSDPSIATVDENGLVTALIPEANGAPRRAPSKNADNTVTITASMTNNDGSVIDGTIDITVSEPTGINDLVVDANVASVKYINAMGQMSDRAFDGLNIMVTTYIDGTTSTVKVVK